MNHYSIYFQLTATGKAVTVTKPVINAEKSPIFTKSPSTSKPKVSQLIYNLIIVNNRKQSMVSHNVVTKFQKINLNCRKIS